MRFKLPLDRIEEPSYDDLVAQTSLLTKQLYCLRQTTQKVLCVYDQQHTHSTTRLDAHLPKPVPGFGVSFFRAATDDAAPLWMQFTLELVVWEHTGDKEVWASVVLDDDRTHRQANIISVRVSDGIIARLQKGTLTSWSPRPVQSHHVTQLLRHVHSYPVISCRLACTRHPCGSSAVATILPSPSTGRRGCSNANSRHSFSKPCVDTVYMSSNSLIITCKYFVTTIHRGIGKAREKLGRLLDQLGLHLLTRCDVVSRRNLKTVRIDDHDAGILALDRVPVPRGVLLEVDLEFTEQAPGGFMWPVVRVCPLQHDLVFLRIAQIGRFLVHFLWLHVTTPRLFGFRP